MLSHQSPFFNSLGIELPPWKQEFYCTFCFVALYFVINYLFLHSDLSTQNTWIQALTNYLYKKKQVTLNSIFGFEILLVQLLEDKSSVNFFALVYSKFLSLLLSIYPLNFTV